MAAILATPRSTCVVIDHHVVNAKLVYPGSGLAASTSSDASISAKYGGEMNNRRTTLRAGPTSPRRPGVVSGYVFKLVRESTQLTQAALAEDLGVDMATVQGWESGRRSLGALRAGDLTRLRMRMSRLGTPRPCSTFCRTLSRLTW